MNRTLSAAFGLLLVALGSGPALAQTAPSAATAPVPLPTHTIRSIDPTDTDFTDLEFLRREIGGARVVMLGEPTHGEGNVFEAKIRLMRFLKEQMGFTTVAFESGFYELDRAQREIQVGTAAREAIEGSVFPIWTTTREFQPIMSLLGKGGLRVAGFDYQLSGGYQEELVEELKAFLRPEKGADAIAYDYLDECISAMGEQFRFPPSHQPLLFTMQVGKARKLLEKVAAGADQKRRVRAAFWLQNLRSLQAMVHDYATNDPGAIDSADFKAIHSNPRDAQMADNLLWYLRQHEQEKVICWGALPHLANKVEVLNNAEMQRYQPMGRAVKAALGEEAVYVLGTLAGNGTHGFLRSGGHKPVPVPATGTMEAELLSRGQDYSFVSLKHDAPNRQLTTYAFQYEPLTGPWSQVVDGFLFLKIINPAHLADPATGAVAAESAATGAGARQSGALNPARQPALAGRASGAAFALSGIVLDRKTSQPVPFATVAVPARSAGTVSDAQGKFRFDVRRGELVQVSSIGYEPATLAAAAGAATVRLAPATFALNDVRVSAQSQNPKRIMQKVIRAAEKNYEQQDYMARVYTRRRLINFDTLRHELEYVSHIFEPAGFRKFVSGFLNLGPKPVHKVLEKRVVVQSARPLGPFDLLEGGQGFLTASADPVRISPLFKAKTLGKFALRLDSVEQRNGETCYVIRFAAKRATLRSTGTYQQAGYSGKVYVREKDYAVLRYEALWQADTVGHNATAHKYYGRKNQISRLYPQVYSDSRTAHVVTYQPAANGRYYVASSVAQGLSIGRILGKASFYEQKYCEEYFEPLPPTALADRPVNEDKPGIKSFEIWQADNTPYRPEFWQTYHRPVPAEPAPTLEATQP
ncbi:erythromycin esterase family protein [Hymenobacter psychrophilus]|uniref:Erythromycin esterase homolog n=1 Tax=Hymenobacter psychrophilus TaxID=651662 RepID=A0A1H3ERS7_9BACT|nr:erythromycin esterase family protein [Hymenobacter psychrophilus]SDX81456.1 Erythromycin esterase homolog [Hymenobacter psychrophilus]